MSHSESVPKRSRRAQQLARTYGGDRDGWARVEEYQEAMAWKADHPNQKSSAASRALDMPRSRVRVWFDGGKPDPARAVEIADLNGWLDAAPGDRVFEALSLCHAWVVAGGCIQSELYMPLFSVSDGDPVHVLKEALTTLGVGWTARRAPERRDERRSMELSPADGATVLGRFLAAVLTAPVGPKAERGVMHPQWLWDAPFETKLRWARTYVSLRGTPFPPEHGYVLQLGAFRTESFMLKLGDWLNQLTGIEDGVRLSGHHLRLRERAAAMLDVEPTLPA